MRTRILLASLAIAMASAELYPRLISAGAPTENPSLRKPYGIEQRVRWTTTKVKGTPDPVRPYRTEAAFPNLKFFEPLALATIPGSTRIAVAERGGKIYTFPDDPRSERAELLVDVKKTIYGLAFHPRFRENGYFYVTYVLDRTATLPNGSRVARFQVRPGNPLQADPGSEKVIFKWPCGGHNGGCIRFGTDGFLYIATGDGSGIADELRTGQDLSDFLAAMLRIDVDHPESGRAYGIPRDNPFVGLKNARPEIWAYGLRQCWKFSIDPKTGNLWAGEVGQDLWESVYVIRRGGNYGWSVQEGSHPFRPERDRGPSPILPPIVEHSHTDFRSITGGLVYYGSRLKDLTSAYIYGDFDTGKIWSLRYDGLRVTEHRELADTTFRIVDFGSSLAGEVYLLDFIGGAIHRLVPTPPATEAPTFPRKLSETGLFASTRDHIPAPGLIPYSVNAPLWSDHALKHRFLALPGDSKIEYNAIEYPQPAPGAPRGWRFPDGTVLVKTFSMEMEKGNPASVRRLETRLLHFEQAPGTVEIGDQLWRGYTYIWNDEQTDAFLLDSGGLDRLLTILDRDAPGGRRRQVWHFPSRAECTLCHTLPAKFVLGVNTLQFNKDHDYGGVVANQLRTLEHLGIFTQPLPAPPEKLPKLADYSDQTLSLNDRARAYLHANCAHCHMKWGGGNADFQLLATINLAETGTLGVRPAHGDFGLTRPEIITPGAPERSMIVDRMKRLGLGRMPHVASDVVDEAAVRLISDWIKQLPPRAARQSDKP